MLNVIDELVQRGFVDQMTGSDLREHLSKPAKVYLGFDPTADSLHLGNLIGIIALGWFQKYGHTPHAIIGGATGMIGDPSGKSSERSLLGPGELKRNIDCLTAFFHKIFRSDAGPQAVVLNNQDWLGAFSLIDFLRDVGKHFRVGPMMAKESVRSRLESEEGMSFTEFSYQLLQGYDFYYLNQKYGVSVQLGGSDQWGNITAGTEFNRKLKGDPLFGLTWPLLTRSDGKKFGKSEEGAIWLSSEKLAPYHFYQYLVRVPDSDVICMLKRLTFLDLEEIHRIEQDMKSSGYEPNRAQKRLAQEVTQFVHGDEGLQAALRVTSGVQPGAQAELSAAILKEIASDMPHATFSWEEVMGKKWIDLAVQIGLVPSKSEAVRLIKNGGAYLNNERIENPAFEIDLSMLIDGIYLLFSSGKKKKFLLEIKFMKK